MDAYKYFKQLQSESNIFVSLTTQREKTKYLYQLGFCYLEHDAIIMESKGNKIDYGKQKIDIRAKAEEIISFRRR